MNCPHCKVEINKHEATRCLDAWVAEHVMGWKPYRVIGVNILYPPSRIANNNKHPVLYKPFDPEREYDFDSSHFFDSSRGGFTEPIVPKYSTEIEIAWRVIEKMRNTQIQGHVGPTRLHSLRQCSGKDWDLAWCSDFGFTEAVLAPTAQLAICRAAIKAKGKEEA